MVIWGEGSAGSGPGQEESEEVVSWSPAPGWRHREAWEWSLRSDLARAGGRGCDSYPGALHAATGRVDSATRLSLTTFRTAGPALGGSTRRLSAFGENRREKLRQRGCGW